MIRAEFTRLLHAPPVRGWVALLLGLVAVWVPTMIRLAVSGTVTGCEFTPYLPFVLASAILVPWWGAALVALASVALLGGLFGGSPAFHLSCFVPAATIFLASSAAMIAAALLVRHGVAAVLAGGASQPSGGVIFSLEKGEVWASWHGQGRPILLGSQRRVSEIMRNFLAQEAEFAERAAPGDGRPATP